MSNDEANKRRRIAEALAAANVDVTTLQNLGSTSAPASLNRSTARLQPDPVLDVLRLSQLMGDTRHPAPSAARPASANPQANGNTDLMATLLSLSQPQPPAPSAMEVTLARLLAGNAPVPSQDLQRLLQPEPVAANASASLLALLGGAAPAPPPPPAPSASAETVLALLNAGVPSSQIAQLLQTPAPSAPPPLATGGLDLETLIALKLATTANNGNTTSADQLLHQQLLQQVLGGTPPAPTPPPAPTAAAPTSAALTSLLRHPQQQQQSNPPSIQQLSDALLVSRRPSVAAAARNKDTAAQAYALTAFQMAKPPATATTAATTKPTKKKTAGTKRKEAPAVALPKAPKGLTGHSPEPLYIECDEERLSAYHVLARQQIEFFEASEEDTSTNARGRNRPIVLGQVGIRCRHCSALPPRRRQRAAMYYPFKLDLLYQACQTLSNVHLCEQCNHIPKDVRLELNKLRGEKTTALVGKKYWADGARIRGIYETEDGMRFEAKKEGAAGAEEPTEKKLKAAVPENKAEV